MYFGPIRARILMAFAALVSTALVVVACGADPTATPVPPTATPTPAPAMDDKPDPTATPTPVPPTPTPEPEPQVLKLGFTVPQSGSYARWGRLVSAMQCAIDEVHASGDLGSTTIELLPEDSKADQAEGVSGLRKLATVNDAPVVMTIFTGIGLAQKPVASELEVVLFSSGIQNPMFAYDSPWVFRNALNTTLNADALIRWLDDYAGGSGEDLNGLRFAYIKEEGNDSIDLQVDRLHVLADALGFEIVAEETFQKDDVSFDTQITKIKAAEPDVVQLMSLGKEMGLIINTMAQQGLQPTYTISGGGAEGNTELIDVAGAAANGLGLLRPGSVRQGSRRACASLHRLLRGKEGNDPDTYATHFYDGTLVIAEALKLGADATSSESMRDHIAQVDEIVGLAGLWVFDEGGDAWAPPGIGHVVNGEFVNLVPQIEPYRDIQ